MDRKKHGYYFKLMICLSRSLYTYIYNVYLNKQPWKYIWRSKISIRPLLLLPSSESRFSFRPLKSECWSPYRSQSEAGRPQRCSSQPLGLYEGGIREASVCVVAIVYQGTRGWLNNPPVNTTIQWETRKWQDPRDLHTHMPFPWSWRIDFVLFGRYNQEKGDGEGSLLAMAAVFWMDTRKRMYMTKSVGWRHLNLTFLQNNKKSKSKQAVGWGGYRQTALFLHDLSLEKATKGHFESWDTKNFQLGGCDGMYRTTL